MAAGVAQTRGLGEPVRVWISGRSPLARAGIKAVLEELGCVVAGASAEVPDLVTVHVVLVLDGGVPETWPSAAAVLFVGDEYLAPSALRPWGVVSAEATPEELLAALGAVAAGLCVLPPSLLAQDFRPLAAPENPLAEPLTAREDEVLQLLAEGLSNRQIAGRLDISEHTVKFHLSAIFAKLGAASRVEALRVATQRGLLLW